MDFFVVEVIGTLQKGNLERKLLLQFVRGHVIECWTIGPQKGGLNDKYGHGAKIWMVTTMFLPVKLPRGMSAK